MRPVCQGGNAGRIPFGLLVRTPTAANFYLSTKQVLGITQVNMPRSRPSSMVEIRKLWKYRNGSRSVTENKLFSLCDLAFCSVTSEGPYLSRYSLGY